MSITYIQCTSCGATLTEWDYGNHDCPLAVRIPRHSLCLAPDRCLQLERDLAAAQGELAACLAHSESHITRQQEQIAALKADNEALRALLREVDEEWIVGPSGPLLKRIRAALERDHA